MTTETQTRNMPAGYTLTLIGDMDQAAAPICFRYEDDDTDERRWTPFQTASARHDWDEAFALVDEWLESQN